MLAVVKGQRFISENDNFYLFIQEDRCIYATDELAIYCYFNLIYKILSIL